LKNKPRTVNLTEKNKPNLRLLKNSKNIKPAGKLNIKKGGKSEKKTSPNVQIYIKTHPNFILQ